MTERELGALMGSLCGVALGCGLSEDQIRTALLGMAKPGVLEDIIRLRDLTVQLAERDRGRG